VLVPNRLATAANARDTAGSSAPGRSPTRDLTALSAQGIVARVPSNERFMCPVCGFGDLFDRPWSAEGVQSDEICPCCGIHFGYDDVCGGRAELRPAFYSAWRERWRHEGMRWWSQGPRQPRADWHPVVQLHSAGFG
jgi:hypothetical protein